MYTGRSKTPPIKPRSNFHRLLTMLHLNGGTLSPIHFYAARGSKPDNHQWVDTGGMRKMSMVSPFKPLSFHYEHRAEDMGLVTIQRYKNRKWVVLLPKGRDVLLRVLDGGHTWTPE